MTSALIVDWLGRGGIAHTTEAWVRELRRAGVHVDVITRHGRELDSTVGTEATDERGRIAAHREVAGRAAACIRTWRPDAVVVQNYLLPPLEQAVHSAARAVDARVIQVVHDHKLPGFLAGTRVGLRRQLRAADQVVAHSAFVGERVARFAGRDVAVTPVPVPLGMLERPRPVEPPLGRCAEPLALHFGVVRRRYKGMDTVGELCAKGVVGWRFAVLGSGAPQSMEGATTLPGYVDAGTLVSAVESAAVSVSPYRRATQSGAIVLAQALGTIPIVSAVGGVPEQVEDGRSGVLVAAGVGVDGWREAFEAVRDEHDRAALAAGAQRAAWEGHARFATDITHLVGASCHR
jgi:glycosyltransferase involved in cell wall biosynthesis